MKPLHPTHLILASLFVLAITTSCTKKDAPPANNEKTLELQPAAAEGHNVSVYYLFLYGPPESTYVSPAPTQNFNGDTILSVTNEGFENFYAANALLKFDGVSAVPADAEVISAKLYLYGIAQVPATAPAIVFNGPGRFGNALGANSRDSVVLQMVSAAWADGSVTWNSAPASVDAGGIPLPASTSQWCNNDTLDVTGMVKIWQANASQNFGCKIAYASGSGARPPFASNFEQMQFYSSYAANAAVRPKLVIVYK